LNNASDSKSFLFEIKLLDDQVLPQVALPPT
jgi:hypothetical protein